MKIDITPADLEAVMERLAEYCRLLQVVQAEYGFTEESERETQEEVARTKELASRLQSQRIIR